MPTRTFQCPCCENEISYLRYFQEGRYSASGTCHYPFGEDDQEEDDEERISSDTPIFECPSCEAELSYSEVRNIRNNIEQQRRNENQEPRENTQENNQTHENDTENGRTILPEPHSRWRNMSPIIQCPECNYDIQQDDDTPIIICPRCAHTWPLTNPEQGITTPTPINTIGINTINTINQIDIIDELTNRPNI